MGQDCIVKIDDKYYHLDRFYIFKSEFKFEKEYKVNDCFKKINKLKLNINNKYNEDDKEYHLCWINILIELIKKYKPKIIIFYDDGDAPEGYYNKKNRIII